MLTVGFAAAIGAELLGIVDEHVDFDDRVVLVALVPAVHPGQHELDGVIAALEKLLAGHGRQIELGCVGGSGRRHN
jgi:hypothetical protein